MADWLPQGNGLSLTLSIACFRYAPPGIDAGALDALNELGFDDCERT